MSPQAAVLAAVAVGLSVSRWRGRWVLATATGLVLPIPALIVAPAAFTWAGSARLRSRRRHRAAAAADVPVLAEVVGLGLSAGLTLTQALGAAPSYLHPALGKEVARLLRRAARGGLGQALAGADGYGRGLYVVTARAVVTGAPLAPAVDSFVREAMAGQRAARLEAARRLPVRLMLPLALLILPGFVLLTVGPTVLAALERFVLPR